MSTAGQGTGLSCRLLQKHALAEPWQALWPLAARSPGDFLSKNIPELSGMWKEWWQLPIRGSCWSSLTSRPRGDGPALRPSWSDASFSFLPPSPLGEFVKTFTTYRSSDSRRWLVRANRKLRFLVF